MATSTCSVCDFSVFVTTYGVGATEGFACGKWFNLSDYSDKDEFISAATEYAKNTLGDSDPELCFPDSNLPSELYNESFINPDLWGLMELDSDDIDMLMSYIKAVGNDDQLGMLELVERAQNSYLGEFDNDADYAENVARESGLLEGIDHVLEAAINWDHVALSYMIYVSGYKGKYFNKYV